MKYKNKYRIISDNFCGYEVQIRYWFFPIWLQCFEFPFNTNTHKSLEDAKEFMEQHRNGTKRKKHIYYQEK